VKDCVECQSLSERYWQLSAELARSKDELAMTPKNAAEYSDRKADVQRLQGLVKDAGIQSSNHRKLHRISN
jgi:hypothetical protein